MVINDLDAEPLREVEAELLAQGAEVAAVAGSVTDSTFPERFVQTAVNEFGRVDILVNNAGYVWNARVEKTTDEQWNAMLDVHLGAPFRIIRCLVQHWKSEPLDEARPHRKIVNVSSISGTHGAIGQIGYSSAKAGLIGLTLSLARELGPDRVNVNAVAFGWIETRLTQEVRGATAIDIEGQKRRVGLSRQMMDDLRARIPLGRGAAPREAAGGVFLLCLPESDYVSGQVLEVDGGLAI